VVLLKITCGVIPRTGRSLNNNKKNVPDISYIRGCPLSQCLIPESRKSFTQEKHCCKYNCIKSDGLDMQKHFLFVETPREAVTWNAEKKLEPNL
jgi:hypothetical protein